MTRGRLSVACPRRDGDEVTVRAAVLAPGSMRAVPRFSCRHKKAVTGKRGAQIGDGLLLRPVSLSWDRKSKRWTTIGDGTDGARSRLTIRYRHGALSSVVAALSARSAVVACELLRMFVIWRSFIALVNHGVGPTKFAR